MTGYNSPKLRKDRHAEQYGDREVMPCPTCGAPVELVRREKGIADHYAPFREGLQEHLATYDEETQQRLREERKGKKTVAVVGMSPASSGLAPYREKNVECWGLNEAHLFDVMKKWDRWFQLHSTSYLMKNMSLKGKPGHWDWLGLKHNKPIYLQFQNPLVPDSVEYPLQDISNKFLSKIRRGTKKVKYYTSTFSYMIALALYEGFNRIEIYGFDMDMKQEYWKQRANAEFWLGVATGLGVEIVLPETSFILSGILYGYRGIDYDRPVEPEDMDD